MNSLYTLGVRQTNSIQADLERLRNGDKSAALLGLCFPYGSLATTVDLALHVNNDRADICIAGRHAPNSG